jgi:tRNA (adenine37-N6)-methyltransferase
VITARPIGRIRTGYRDRADTPVQTAVNVDELGTVELEPPYRDGLEGLDGFEYAWLLTWMTPDADDRAPVEMRQTPFLLTGTGREMGLFAMRGPRRPNPIGLHLVRIVSVRDDGFTFAGVDMLDGTPLLDVKPWVAPADVPTGRTMAPPVRCGWFDDVSFDRGQTPRSLRDGPGEG